MKDEKIIEIMKLSSYEDEILDLIQRRDEFTTSDLQAIVGALVRKISKHE
jgi:uncharacterized protein YfkK (UPF0435 family)